MRSARTSVGSMRRSTTLTLANKIDTLGAQGGHMKGELIAEIRRVDIRIDGVERELRVAIDIRERLAALEARRA
jgi:hypothetical protein